MSAATPQQQILRIVNNHWQSCRAGCALEQIVPTPSPLSIVGKPVA